MFTGIIEEIGKVISIEKEQSNIHFTLSASMSNELKIDQSLAHNGCCLTVVQKDNSCYTVTAIQETLDKTNLKDWIVGSKINLERCMKADGRFDGHIVQGHVDCIAKCTDIEDLNGSWKFTFDHNETMHKTVEKGSVTINGTSLADTLLILFRPPRITIEVKMISDKPIIVFENKPTSTPFGLTNII